MSTTTATSDSIESTPSTATVETPKQATKKTPLKLLHEQYQQFFDREETKQLLSTEPKHKHASILQNAFHDETGEVIALSWIYRVLKLKPRTETKTE
jgi:hypothetical protein